MVKLKSLYFHDIPIDPEILKEMRECSMELSKIILPILLEYDPTIALSALIWFHASFLSYNIDDIPGELTKAGKMTALSLIKNIEILEERRKKMKK